MTPEHDPASRDATTAVDPAPAPSDPPSEASRTAPWLLAAGAAAGLALATFGLLETSPGAIPLASETAAVVGERSIRRVDYERVLAGVESDLRNPIDDAMRRRVLDRMIDEELLVQRALELGLAVVDRRVRGELTSGLIDSIVSEADREAPSERDVARHYEENLDFFTRPGRLRARVVYFAERPGEAAGLRAREALVRLRAGESADAVESALADSQVSRLPDVLLPASKVRDYVGPAILEVLLALEPGVWSEPIETRSGVYLATPVEREAASQPPLSEIVDLVRQDLVRRRGDEALRDYLDTLRAETAVEINESVFAPRTRHE